MSELGESGAPAPDFEDLSLAEALAMLRRSPRRTLAALLTVANRPARPSVHARQEASPAIPLPAPVPRPVASHAEDAADAALLAGAQSAVTSADRRAVPALVLMALGLGLAWFGNTLYFRPSPNGLLNDVSWASALPVFALAALCGIVAAVIGVRGRPPAEDAGHALLPSMRVYEGVALGLPRLALLGLAMAFAVPAYALNGGNRFTALGVLSWLLAIGCIAAWGFASAGAPINPLAWWREKRTSARTFIDQNRTTIAAVAFITLLGAAFRLQNLDTMLPEMTSDHVEKLLDAQRVADGDFDVFFANNGGREPFQMYALAALALLPGIDIDFMGLKLLAVIESVLTIPLFWWLGRALVGARDGETRALGNWVGLALALLLSVGYWHAAVTRVALRIILTPLLTALLLIFLARAMRHNRRADYVWAGLILGFSLYTYQAARMLPVVVLIGVGLVVLFNARRLRERASVIFNLAVLVVVSFIIFLPLFRFSVDYPNDFWRRTSGRLFGDDIITETLPDGRLVERNATLAERVTAFSDNLPTLAGNMLRAVGMFNYRGDIAWFHNAPGYPAMDTVTGAFLVVGVSGWLVLTIRKRDTVYVLVPLALLVMLLPSALSIALPIENPSHTRASGAMPTAYFLAAFGLATLCVGLWRLAPRRGGAVLAAALLLLTGALAYTSSAERLLGAYRDWYIDSWKPLSAGGQMLEGFATSDGAYGNAFMLAFPHWWDYRAIGIEAGLPPGVWPNGDIALANLPQFMADAADRDPTDPFRLDVERDLLFMISPDDGAAEAQFQAWFPQGQARLIETYKPGDTFRVYRVPALGEEGFRKFLESNGIGSVSF